jgi:hypothetical protein
VNLATLLVLSGMSRVRPHVWRGRFLMTRSEEEEEVRAVKSLLISRVVEEFRG